MSSILSKVCDFYSQPPREFNFSGNSYFEFNFCVLASAAHILKLNLIFVTLIRPGTKNISRDSVGHCSLSSGPSYSSFLP